MASFRYRGRRSRPSSRGASPNRSTSSQSCLVPANPAVTSSPKGAAVQGSKLRLPGYLSGKGFQSDGLPTEYSIIATFKVTNDTAQTSWDLWQVTDPKGREQVGLRFQPDTQSLDFFYTGPKGTQMVRTFHGLQKLFNGEWHKLAMSIKGTHVRLLIDCEEVSVESIDEPRPVSRQGYTSIVKRAARDRSASVCCNLESE
ncbi:hypothetical protein GOODEAATRI_015232 [Goodea atripinnis]|uniref:Thrombospondin-like N-terminal domain-containing protein n=1 Tax=Goodea atripinnis TaxID=208336 RepID=A0ABV0PEK8_9TELE